MESEKVKEIKNALECIVNVNAPEIELNYYGNLHLDILTLINELERDVLVGKKIAERPKTKEWIVAPIYVLPNVESPEMMLKLGEENLVYQFAEMLKDRLRYTSPTGDVLALRDLEFKRIEVEQYIDETLKEFME